ncbi:MarR family winged helix-turn-helix transcriptional regulator [Amylibacter sp. SFDW26]|uniref:MarR family winged helix-turn-helix transcriptional regulator n=1 Tax=Amylibacter sp. SFDW26 TaxID=2652722 RepID=UPI001D00FB8C|nr:MarR family transcriptional regulator [Amylibacter sp. SFDW26]
MTKQLTVSLPETLKLDSQLCFALHSASNKIDQMYRPLLATHGLTYAQYIVLMSLSEKDNVPITVLAKKLGVSKATMTPLLRRLEAKNLVTRKIESTNERQKQVKLTQEGLALLSESCDATDKVFEDTGLTKAQADGLIALCKVITQK